MGSERPTTPKERKTTPLPEQFVDRTGRKSDDGLDQARIGDEAPSGTFRIPRI